MKLTWRNKLLFAFILFAIVPTAVVALLALDTFRDNARAATLESLQGLARAKAEAIDQFTDSRNKDVQRIAGLLAEPVTKLLEAEKKAKEEKEQKENGGTEEPEPIKDPLPALQDANQIEPEAPEGSDSTGQPPEPTPEEPATPPEDSPEQKAAKAAKSEVQRTLGLVLGEQATFEELLIIAPDGRVMVSTFSEHEGKTAADVEYFKRGRAATFVQPVFQSPITGELTMVIATPIRSPENQDLGVLAARLNLKRFFRLINDYTGLGKTGETMVGKKIGEQIVFMAPTRHDAEAALMRTMPAGSDSPLVAAARGERDIGVTTDYRGEKVFAAWTFAPVLEWGVVTKIDADEALAPLERVETRLLLITLVVIGFAVVVSLAFARAMVAPLRELKDASEKISKGDFEVELDIRSRDEIGELADSFERMVAAIKFFREQSHEEESDPPAEPVERRPETKA